MALYASHLPLDAHSTLGNNALIARALGLAKLAPFCKYHGNSIGWKGEFKKAVALDDLTSLVRRKIHNPQPSAISQQPSPTVLPFGKTMVKTLGIVCGGAAGEVRSAIADGLDCYLTGEANLSAYNFAKSAGINMIAAGHYATERFGVKALGGWLKSKFEISCNFLDFDISL